MHKIVSNSLCKQKNNLITVIYSSKSILEFLLLFSSESLQERTTADLSNAGAYSHFAEPPSLELLEAISGSLCLDIVSLS